MPRFDQLMSKEIGMSADIENPYERAVLAMVKLGMKSICMSIQVQSLYKCKVLTCIF